MIARQPRVSDSDPRAIARPDGAESKVRNAAGLCGAIILSAIFGLAGVSKALTLTEFWAVMRASHLLPEGLIVPVSVLLISAEIMVAPLMLRNSTRRHGFASVVLLSLLFTGYSAIASVNRDRVPCGCFSSLFLMSHPAALLLDIVLLSLSLCLILNESQLRRFEWQSR